METRKKLDNESLTNATGGGCSEPDLLFCPHCQKKVAYYIKQVGSGCDEETQRFCKDCNNRID